MNRGYWRKTTQRIFSQNKEREMMSPRIPALPIQHYDLLAGEARWASRFSRNLFNSQQLLKYSRILTTPPTSATRRETGVGKFIIVHFLSDSKSLSRFMQDGVLLWFQPILLCCALIVRWWVDEDDLIKNLISLFVENLDWVKQIKDLVCVHYGWDGKK